MKNFTFHIDSTITIEAENEEEARSKARHLLSVNEPNLAKEAVIVGAEVRELVATTEVEK